MMQQRGMMSNEPESNMDVDSVLMWFYKVLPMRKRSENGLLPICFSELKDLHEYKPTIYCNEYLADIVSVIDEVFRRYEQEALAKLIKEKQKNNTQ